MKIAFISNKIEPTGGDHILQQHIVSLSHLGHTTDLYIQDIPKDPNQYDLIVVSGQGGAIKGLDINHPKKIWLLQNYDPYIFGFRDDINKLYDHYQNYIVYSKDLANIVQHHHGKKNIVMIPNGVEFDDLVKYQKITKCHKKSIVWMAGYMGGLKGGKLANDVFKELNFRGWHTISITATGDKLPNAQTHYTNPSFSDKCQIIANCNLMLHTSIFETFCLCIMESMALGTPVIGTNSLGNMEYCTNDNYVTTTRDVNAIVNAIEDLYNSPKYALLQKNGIQTASTHNWANIIKSVEAGYAQFIGMEYEYNLATKGFIAEDIAEHIVTLREYADKCESVTELGVRTGASTRAFLASKCSKLVSIDIIPMHDDVKRLMPIYKKNWIYLQANDLHIQIEPTDLLFIDTYHTGEQLEQELRLHADKAKKYIILHDTTTWGQLGHGGVKGLNYAVTDFLNRNTNWTTEKVYTNNNGLTILRRC